MSDCCSAPGLMAFEVALSQLLDNVYTTNSIKSISIENALGKVLADTVTSPVSVPPHNNSAMDGYAFKYSSLEQIAAGGGLQLAGRSFAGEPFTGVTQSGQCIRIMTGAKLPDCCDTVVMQENTRVDKDTVVLTKSPSEKGNVRYKGEDIAQGVTVFEKGHKLSAVDIGMIASLGIAKVKVFGDINVAILSTGDELRLPGEELAEGDIYESNRFVLRPLLQKLGVNILDFGIIRDDKEAIRQAFTKADQLADVVISSGGVSVGEADYTKEVLSEIGEINFWKIAMKPGKPFAFGKLSNSVFFGLPGNPVSALVTFYQLGVPGIEKMQGLNAKAKTRFKAATTTKLKKSPGRMDFQRAVLSYDEQGMPIVTSTGSQGSGILTSLGRANSFIVLDKDQGTVEAGESVWVEPFSHLLM
ncbi:molybdopterin molybdotransferase MoeA [Thalassotalea crassostreae]|uniref:molybdopterin molybdotransferase MoeA n=1 Tax=Thalassotalea crassostreae TaxID=1763536 RepID=UPI000838AE80|nr:molybdopterin molybdotransferase MoeA [Thalassotalea crassostreae]